jgi:hypothetical protein
MFNHVGTLAAEFGCHGTAPESEFLWDLYNFGRATISKSYEPSGTSL